MMKVSKIFISNLFNLTQKDIQFDIKRNAIN